MKLDVFDYSLPAEKIATKPAHPRESARLLDLSGGGIADYVSYELGWSPGVCAALYACTLFAAGRTTDSIPLTPVALSGLPRSSLDLTSSKPDSCLPAPCSTLCSSSSSLCSC